MEHVTEHVVERQIELEASPEEVWRLVREPESWLADAGSVDLRPGARAPRRRRRGPRVEVETVDEGARVVFRWWDEDHGEDGASRVEITLLPGSAALVSAGRRPADPLAIRETLLLPWRGRRCVGRGPGRGGCAGRCGWHAWPSCACPCACERSESAIATMSERLDGVLAAWPIRPGGRSSRCSSPADRRRRQTWPAGCPSRAKRW